MLFADLLILLATSALWDGEFSKSNTTYLLKDEEAKFKSISVAKFKTSSSFINKELYSFRASFLAWLMVVFEAVFVRFVEVKEFEFATFTATLSYP